MTDSIDPLLVYHRKFCELAQEAIDPNDLRFHKAWSRCYYELHRAGFSVEEMELVVRYVQGQNKKATALEYRRKIVPSKILGDIERFAEDLAEAKRLAALKTTPKQQVVDEWRRTPEPPNCQNTASSIKDILRKVVI